MMELKGHQEEVHMAVIVLASIRLFYSLYRGRCNVKHDREGDIQNDAVYGDGFGWRNYNALSQGMPLMLQACIYDINGLLQMEDGLINRTLCGGDGSGSLSVDELRHRRINRCFC
ncbi:hypothetical protein RJT34_09320 [Clitoria ternatea]|uniref:Uncharacterized protein n=1 Tax=Clitoria ternatea TaxID=43366 RepID=A0AAN9PUK2_CLITE